MCTNTCKFFTTKKYFIFILLLFCNNTFAQSSVNLGFRVNKFDINNNLLNILLYSNGSSLEHFSLSSNVSTEISYTYSFPLKDKHKINLIGAYQNDRIDIITYFTKVSFVNLKKFGLGLGYEFNLYRKNNQSIGIEVSGLLNRRVSFNKEKILHKSIYSSTTYDLNNDTISSFKEQETLTLRSNNLYLTPKLTLNMYLKSGRKSMKIGLFYQMDFNKSSNFHYSYIYDDFKINQKSTFNYETDKFRNKIIGITIGYVF